MSSQSNPGSVVFGLLRKISRLVGSEGRALEVIQYFLNNESALTKLIAMVPGDIGIVPRVKLVQTSKQYHSHCDYLSNLSCHAAGYGMLPEETYDLFSHHPELFPNKRVGVTMYFFGSTKKFDSRDGLDAFRSVPTLKWNGQKWESGSVIFRQGLYVCSTDFAIVPA